MNRRSFLSCAGLVLTTPFAGCLSAIDGNQNSQGTENLPVRFWFEEVSLSASEQESVNPLVFRELSTAEQEIVQTAIEEGGYTVEQESEPPALENLRDRIEQRTGSGETLEAHPRREVTHHRLGFADGDHIISHPDH